MLDPAMTPEQQKAYGKALKKVEACHRGRQEALDLSGLGLSRLPPEIGLLTTLADLNLANNQLSSLPPEIGQLTALTTLYLFDNQLSILPPEIGQLTALTKLQVDINQLSILPPEIGQLTALTMLHVERNQLGCLPPEIGHLTALTHLYCSSNHLSILPSEIGQLTALTTIYFSSNQLSSLPSEIGRLTALTTLHLSGNQLSSLPPEIGQLTALSQLSVSHNQLNSLPSEIGQLTSLTMLYLSNNQLSSLPPQIGQLAALTTFALGDNQLTCLPTQIGQLTALKYLGVENNQLSTLPSEIGQVKALTTLNVASNQLSILPPAMAQLTALATLDLTANQLKKLSNWLTGLSMLDHLFLHDNPALQLSPTVLGTNLRQTDKGWASAKSILDFYFGRLLGKTRPLDEVKLILVGRGGAGKTSTVQALRGKPFNETEESTPGIALCDWKMEGCKKGPVTAHVWDFAGQVITHALHQFFFSVRSVYVVLLTGRENNERDDAEYWLRLIKAFGTDEQGNGPPVIVALNKWDEPGCRPRVDRGALQERYPFIRGFVEMDCKTGTGVSELKAALCLEVDSLLWVREPVPEAWDTVRLALVLAVGIENRAHLTYAEYRALCAKYGVTEEGQQDSLSEILHRLGAVLNYRNDPRLREAAVLQPQWLTHHVYALVRRAEENDGVLTQADVDAVLVEEKDVAMRAYLLKIMERFEIAYTPRATNEDGGLWLVPQALPDSQPNSAMAFREASEATRLRYTYPALPEGLVARAIVRLHEFIEEVNGSNQQWASGVILSREGARALIRTEPQDRQVMITATGPTKARQQLAGLCQAEMRDIHAEIRGLDPVEETQVEGTWVATATLEADERKNTQTGIPTKERGTVMVDPALSNNAYSEKLARTKEVWKPTVFISYSKNNVNQRKRLESELKMLKNEGLLADLWHDRMIDPGDDWNGTIQRELSEADVVIILASSAALSTDYITIHEIPKALELHEAAKTVVVPVILEVCRWDKTALGALNALPEKGKALNTWNPQSTGWKSVADGLATVFEKLMEKGGAKKRDGAQGLAHFR